jgi:hypothetical protein
VLHSGFAEVSVYLTQFDEMLDDAVPTINVKAPLVGPQCQAWKALLRVEVLNWKVGYLIPRHSTFGFMDPSARMKSVHHELTDFHAGPLGLRTKFARMSLSVYLRALLPVFCVSGPLKVPLASKAPPTLDKSAGSRLHPPPRR